MNQTFSLSIRFQALTKPSILKPSPLRSTDLFRSSSAPFRSMSSTSSSLPFALERSVAISAVARASSLTSKVFHNLVKSDTVTKSDKSPVTVGDFSAQAVVNTVLTTHFPKDPIVGEEDASDLKQAGKEDLKKQVIELANEALKGSAKACPALSGDEKNGWGESELSEEVLLKNIDKGNFEGGNTGREFQARGIWAV